jgi:hypothetical protein
LWHVEYDIIEEGYARVMELRGIDEGQKVLQILADPLEIKTCENREDRAGQGRQTSACRIRASSRGLEFDHKITEAGQRGEGGGQRVG